MFDRVRFIISEWLVRFSALAGWQVVLILIIPMNSVWNNPILGAQAGRPKDEAVNEPVLIVNFKQVHPTILQFSSVVRGEPIWVKKKSRFKLKLLNGGDSPLVFDEIKVGGDCLTVTCDANEIYPGEIVEATLEYIAPISRSPNYVIGIQFFLAGKQIAVVSISGELHGLLHLDSATLESKDLHTVWHIPILATTPVSAANLELIMPESLRDLEGSIVEKEGKPYIEVSGPSNALGISGLSGIIKIQDTQVGVNASALFSFLRKPKVRVSPMIARFMEKETGSSAGEMRRFEAFVLVQSVESSIGNEEGIQGEAENIFKEIKCHSTTKDLQIRTVRINERLYRAYLSFSISKEEPLPSEIDIAWNISTERENFAINGTGLVFEEN